MFLDVRDQILHQHKTTGKLILPYIGFLRFWTAVERLLSNSKNKGVGTSNVLFETSSHPI
jgi:hypothetical protein